MSRGVVRMHWGLTGLSQFPFLQAGNIAVLVGVAGMAAVFPLGRRLGAHRAIAWVNIWLVSLAVVLSVILLWAIKSDQWARFGALIGWSVMAEMVVLATMFVTTTWFMSASYATSLYKESQ